MHESREDTPLGSNPLQVGQGNALRNVLLYKYLCDPILEIVGSTQSYPFAILVHNQYHRSDTDGNDGGGGLLSLNYPLTETDGWWASFSLHYSLISNR